LSQNHQKATCPQQTRLADVDEGGLYSALLAVLTVVYVEYLHGLGPPGPTLLLRVLAALEPC
jgi:hypothetical protein